MRGSSKPEMLSEVETEELEKALGDSFDSFTSTGGEELLIDVSEIYPNPLFGSHVRVRLPVSDPNAEVHSMTSQDWDSEELHLFFSDFQIDDAPEWFDTNPFQFNVRAIRDFFERRVETIRGEIRQQYDPLPIEQEPDSSEDIPWGWSPTEDEETDILTSYWPEYLSKDWFEIHIFEEFEHLDFLVGIQQRHKGPFDRASHFWGTVGRIGRMVEHYRWRFRFEADVIRGKKGLDSARAGGTERAKSTSPVRRSILRKMEELVAKGHSISSAASLAFQAGHGKSAGANRKLWQRHKHKNGAC